MSASQFECPNCGCNGLDVRNYESMIVVTADFALFTLDCPACGRRISGLRAIPEDLLEEVQFAALEVGAGMGRMD